MSNIFIRNGILVRPSNADDAVSVHRLLGLIADLHREGRPDMFPNLKSKYSLEEVIQRLSENDNGVFVAVCNQQTVGYIFCDILKEGIGETLYIDDLCVDPDFRHQGIATALMDYACLYGREKNCRQLMLNVWEFNSSAVAFYEKYGLKTRTRHMEINL